MLIFLATLFAIMCSILIPHANLELENLALRHQIGVQDSCTDLGGASIGHSRDYGPSFGNAGHRCRLATDSSELCTGAHDKRRNLAGQTGRHALTNAAVFM